MAARITEKGEAESKIKEMLSHALKTEYLSDFGFFIRSLTTLTAPTQKTSLLSADNADITSFERMQKEKHFFCTHNARIVQMFLFYFLIISTGGKKKAGRQKRKGIDAHLQN